MIANNIRAVVSNRHCPCCHQRVPITFRQMVKLWHTFSCPHCKELLRPSRNQGAAQYLVGYGISILLFFALKMIFKNTWIAIEILCVFGLGRLSFLVLTMKFRHVRVNASGSHEEIDC